MEGFTPAFFLQVVIAIGSAGAMYGAIRADMKNLMRSIDDDRRLREMHAKEDDESFRDIRDELQVQHGRIASLEAQHNIVKDLAEALRR